MDRLKIKVQEIYNYSFEELTGSKYSNPVFSNKIGSFSDWELLNLFRKRVFNNILLKVLSLKLEIGLYSPARTNDELDKNQFLIESTRELLIFPSNDHDLSILSSDTRSVERIIKFINLNPDVRWHIPDVLINQIMDLDSKQINWLEKDAKYMEECISESSASSYNGGAGHLAQIQIAIDNGAQFIVNKKTIKTDTDFRTWISKSYPTFLDLVEKRLKTQIIDS